MRSLTTEFKAGQVALQQGLDNFVVKFYRPFRRRDHCFGLCFLSDYTVTEAPVAFLSFHQLPPFFQTTFLQQFKGLITRKFSTGFLSSL